MKSVTYSEYMGKTGESIIILVAIIVFCIYKLFKNSIDNEYIIIGTTSLIGIIAIGRLGSIVKKASQTDAFSISKIDSKITGLVIIYGLGLLSIYIFLVKGLYGIYLLFDNFTWTLLAIRVIIIFLSFRLVLAVSKIQTVFKSIETKNYNRK